VRTNERNQQCDRCTRTNGNLFKIDNSVFGDIHPHFDSLIGYRIR